MLELFNIDTLQGTPRIVVGWARFLDVIQSKILIRQNRFDMSTPHQSGCMRLIKNLLFDVDTMYLLTREDDTTRYFETIQYLGHLAEKFDAVKIKKHSKGIFYDHAVVSKVDEYIVSIKHRSAMDMPMDLSWKEWEATEVHPVTILRDNCYAPAIDLVGDLIEHERPSSIAVVGIDIPVLILKWIAYVKEFGEESIQNPEPFIHHYVVGPLHMQIVNMWLLHMLRSLSMNPTVGNAESIASRFECKWVPQSTMLQGLKDAAELMHNLYRWKISIGDVLRTGWLMDGSIEDLIHARQKKCIIPDHRQYRYLELLSNHPIIGFILNMYLLNIGTPATETVLRKFKRKLNHYKRESLVSMAPGDGAKDSLKYIFDDLELRVL